LEQRQAVISSVLAKRLAMKPGDNLRLEVQGRTYPITVATVVNDYSMGGLVVFLDRRAAERLFHSGSPDLYVITRAPQSPADLEKNLQTFAVKEGLLLQSFEELRLKFDRLINGIVSSLFVLMAIGYIVGGLGVSNTLAMSVLEQTREIGLLRIIGMTRRQVRRLVLVEGLMIGTIGALLGALAGATTAYVIHLCNWVLLDRSVAFELHGWLLISSIGGCVLVAILASWAPARRATQLDLLTAMSYE
jgi:putative ABC transport system permease protein